MEIISVFILVTALLAFFLFSHRINIKRPSVFIPVGYMVFMILFLIILFKTCWILECPPEINKIEPGYAISLVFESIADFFERVLLFFSFLLAVTAITLAGYFKISAEKIEIRKGILRVVLINVFVIVCGTVLWLFADYL